MQLSHWIVMVACALSCQAMAIPCSAADQEKPTWRAGVAKINITPEERLTMAGYASRTEPVEGTVSELFAKALALEDHAGNRVVFLTLDLIGVDAKLRSEVTQQVEAKHGLSSKCIVMNASHTHCGPAYTKPEAAGYRATLTEKLASVIGQAIEKLQPASISYAYARCSFAMNRRTPSESGFKNHPNPDGPVDPTVPTLRVNTPDGNLQAVMFGYACHNTTLSFRNWCGDYAGYAQSKIEADHPGAVALFFMGCGGDQNPYPRGKVEYAEQHGATLATAVEAALEGNQKQFYHQRTLRGTLQCQLETVQLEYADGRPALAYPIQTVQIGKDLLWIALASEATIDYSLRLQRELQTAGGPIVWVAGYSNAMEGYIPSRRILKEGGYEADSRPWQLSIEGRIIDQVHAMTAQLQGEQLFVPTPASKEHAFTPGIEGPACDGKGNLYVVNFQRQQTIGRITPDGKAEVFVQLPGESVGNGIRVDRSGQLFVADYIGHNILKVDPETKKISVHAHNDQMNQPNDLAIANDGTLYASDPNWKAGTGQIWRIGTDGSTLLVAEQMGTTNGIDLSPDNRTLYVNESSQRKIWAFDVEPNGTLSNKRLLREFPDFGFDGMRVDVDGNLYVTRHGKGSVVKLTPQGDTIREISTLGAKPSNICFGGTDGRTAFVTEVEHGRVISFRTDRPGWQW